MYSGAMPMATFSRYGTGRDGSLGYSSWPSSGCASAARSSARVPPACAARDRGCTAAGGHDDGFDVLQVRAEVAGLPEGVVGAVLQRLVPEGGLALEVPAAGLGERSELEEELVAVRRVVIEARVELLGRLGARPIEA